MQRQAKRRVPLPKRRPQMRSGLQYLRRIRKSKTGGRKLYQYVMHYTGNPVAVRRAPHQTRNSPGHKSIVKDVDSSLTALRIFNDPFRRHSSPVRLKPGINYKMRDRQDSSRPGDLSHRRRNEPERRTKPAKRMTRLTECVGDRLIAPGKIMPESVDVPQISKPMVERVIYQKMPGGCNRTSLFWPDLNLATNQTEACFHFKLA